MPHNTEGPLFMLLQSAPVACAMKTHSETYCGRELNDRQSPVSDGHFQVCAICRAAAEVDGVELPKSTTAKR